MALIRTITVAFLQALALILSHTKPGAFTNSTDLNLGLNTSISSSQGECFAGLSCKFGKCTDDFKRCNCYPGWSGLLCDKPCHLECEGRGVCTIGADELSYCKCHDGYTGDLCDKLESLTTQIPSSSEAGRFVVSTITPLHSTDSDPVVTSLRPISDRECPRGFECRHGYCLKPFTCACDEGWVGMFCHKQVLPCSLECGRHGQCKEVGRQQVCVCDKGFYGNKCEEYSTTECDNCTTNTSPIAVLAINMSTETTTTTHIPPKTTPTTTLSTSQPGNQTSSSAGLPVNEQCMPGFVCQHGGCVKGRLACKCNPGWTGIFCHRQCPLDCGEHGQCSVQPGRSPYCSCNWPYTGTRCQNQRNVSLPETGKISTTSTLSPTTKPTTILTTSTFDNSTLRPLAERTCVPGFVCRHGYCKPLKEHSNGSMSGVALECVCDRGWKGVFCHSRCSLDCGNHGNCSEFANSTLYCSCDYKYMGPRCDQLRPLPKPIVLEPVWHWWVVGACVFVLLILVILLIALPYWLWKRKEIFIMKIVYMFQPFEDEDEKLYDAFVSYKSTEQDEHFVVHTLYPKLEKMMDFKLCLHFRDFLPGETIANNIVKAMENSRRTILILTPSYVQSEFCRFEYQRAQHEMLKRKQRIIPIVLQDITSDRKFMDETLKTILDTITYIAWPSDEHEKKIDKFWKRLELSMPKKRKLQNSIESNEGDLSDVSSDHIHTSNSTSLPETKSKTIKMASINISKTDDLKKETLERLEMSPINCSVTDNLKELNSSDNGSTVHNDTDISKINFFENFSIPDLELSFQKV